MTLPAPASQVEIDAAHTRYLQLAADRDRLVDALDEYDEDGAGVPDELHDERDDIDRHVLDAAEDLLATLGYSSGGGIGVDR